MLPVSVEFFPPGTEKGLNGLIKAAKRLNVLHPEYCSVTYGAGGTTRDATYATVEALVSRGWSVSPHLSFGGDDESVIAELLSHYVSLGIDRLVVLRGDAPSAESSKQSSRRYAVDLIRFVRERFGDHFHISVAAYPEVHPLASSAEADLHWFKVKVEAGADKAITQYFYNADAYEDFVDRCLQAGINIPIIPGMMPITSFEGSVNFAEKCGAEIPRWLLKRMEQYKDDTDSLRAFGVDVLVGLCEKLRELGVPGLHFYTLNQSRAVVNVCAQLASSVAAGEAGGG